MFQKKHEHDNVISKLIERLNRVLCRSHYIKNPKMSSVKPAPETASYWQAIWDAGETSWRGPERGGKSHVANLDKQLQHITGSADTTADVASLAGAHVLVPLCGDSPALRQLVSLGCHVVGVDLAAVAIAQTIAADFEGDEFARTEHAGGAIVEYTLAANSGKHNGGSAKLFVGDFFAVVKDILAGQRQEAFDFIIDRASMVALPPSMHSDYVAALLSVMTKDVAEKQKKNGSATHLFAARASVVLLETVHHKPGVEWDGPPHNIVLSDVTNQYNAERGFAAEGAVVEVSVGPFHPTFPFRFGVYVVAM
jgi:hypothetical protein